MTLEMPPKTKTIPAEVKEEVQQIIDRFNKDELGEWSIVYSARFRGRHLYLDRDDGLGSGAICRLTYTGDMKNWEFAIYKYSTNRYDPEEWWFPGAEEVDGTIEGALRAGMKAYG
jgi:hypothetical protein